MLVLFVRRSIEILFEMIIHIDVVGDVTVNGRFKCFGCSIWNRNGIVTRFLLRSIGISERERWSDENHGSRWPTWSCQRLSPRSKVCRIFLALLSLLRQLSADWKLRYREICRHKLQKKRHRETWSSRHRSAKSPWTMPRSRRRSSVITRSNWYPINESIIFFAP